MDTPTTNQSEQAADREGGVVPDAGEGTSNSQVETKTPKSSEKSPKSKSKKPKDPQAKAKSKKSKKAKEVVVSESEDSESSSDSGSDNSDSSSSDSDEDSETEAEKEKRKRRKAKKKAKKSKDKKKGKSKKSRKEVSSDSEDSDSDEESEPDEDSEAEDVDDAQAVEDAQLQLQLMQMQQLRQQQAGLGQGGLNTGLGYGRRNQIGGAAARIQAAKRAKQLAALGLDAAGGKKGKKGKKDKKKRASKLDYHRVDQLWDSTIHNYKLTDTAEDEESSEYDQYLFNVRRTFDWEGKYKTTVVDIKSKLLKEALNEVMDGVKGVSLVEETPIIDPNLLFLYLEDLREMCKELKNKKITIKKGKKKAKKRQETKRKHLKVLLKYLDKDYAATKKTLYPMLESGIITFDLLWALYKPNTLAYTTTYGSADEPRAFKIELAEKEFSFMKGEWYNIEGRYLEYDGKTWGMGTMDCDVPAFKGARKITSLNCYPLKYHKNEVKLRADLIARGKKFVSLQGVNYKSHEGMAYLKKRKQIIKVNINGRIMVDPAIHRRILPNYNVSTVKPKDPDLLDDSDDEDSEDGCCCEESSDEEQHHHFEQREEKGGDDDEPRTKLKMIKDDKDRPTIVEVPVDADGQEIVVEKLEEVLSKKVKEDGEVKEDDKKELPTFTDEEYLIASPVVLGFAFTEKLWLEFTVSGVKDIVWNEGAYESLVLEDNTKEIVKALVESHKYHPAESIDDVIQGKGKGLVAVLHGPPGTGKTLTAEGISELLKCPLYMVSAGELGTDPRTLEGELQKILDIAHAWGAVLLLDEADVFLEKRTIQDIHRNALVSIFLRLLEYFQGILFLTTNRVETFDDAFQSRIHIALRYGELNLKAKKSVFKAFIERVRILEGVDTMPFTEDDYNTLAKNNLNGRQIKNTVRTAQALAVNKGEPLSMEHIKKVLDVSNAFDRDLKGGPGFEDAMRGYF
ncbi:related to TOB3 (member of AAA-ATPase family) [Phialocephala subalpina]|uniref:Related to TOB3 (Member of AAA-ATPase family) n=1 Tax=Phialocephala subalpina TaxID=576137 RepID=A0A1L7XIK1_9HELO|nr:related to TOB3 (member of AAA-ATPase family) [Phialocephala subalpina]